MMASSYLCLCSWNVGNCSLDGDHTFRVEGGDVADGADRDLAVRVLHDLLDRCSALSYDPPYQVVVGENLEEKKLENSGGKQIWKLALKDRRTKDKRKTQADHHHRHNDHLEFHLSWFASVDPLLLHHLQNIIQTSRPTETPFKNHDEKYLFSWLNCFSSLWKRRDITATCWLYLHCAAHWNWNESWQKCK